MELTYSTYSIKSYINTYFSHYAGLRKKISILLPFLRTNVLVVDFFPLVNAKCKLHYSLPEVKTRGTAGHQCQTESRLRIAGLRYSLFPSNHCIFLSSTDLSVLPHRRFPLHTSNHPHILLPTSTSPPGLVRVTSSSQRFIQL